MRNVNGIRFLSDKGDSIINCNKIVFFVALSFRKQSYRLTIVVRKIYEEKKFVHTPRDDWCRRVLFIQLMLCVRRKMMWKSYFTHKISRDENPPTPIEKLSLFSQNSSKDTSRCCTIVTSLSIELLTNHLQGF